MLSEDQQQTIKQILAPLKPTYLGVFGSFARNEEGTQSDLDLLVDFQEPVDLLTLVRVENELTKKLGIKVDLVSKNALSPYVAPYIEKDLKEIA